jgi:hypothetical protein
MILPGCKPTYLLTKPANHQVIAGIGKSNHMDREGDKKFSHKSGKDAIGRLLKSYDKGHRNFLMPLARRKK